MENLANLDHDADLEIVLLTAHSGVVVYDLPGSAAAKILWNTGRGSFARSGSVSIDLGGAFVMFHSGISQAHCGVLPYFPQAGPRPRPASTAGGRCPVVLIPPAVLLPAGIFPPL